MDETRRRTTQFSRAARTRRILKRLSAGWTYDEVAGEEGLTARRVRQIVAEHLKRREADEGGTHANIQIDRLSFAMRIAGEALAKGDVRAITPFIKVIDRLDRYQELAREAAPARTAADEVVMQSLIARIRDTHTAAPGPPAPDVAAPQAPGPVADPAVAAPCAPASDATLAAAPPASPSRAIGPGDFFPFIRP